MKKVVILLLGVIYLSSCTKDENNCQPETVSANWLTQKEVLVEFDPEYERNNYRIVDGKKLLFTYHRSGAQCDNIYDDEWGERLVFQVELNLTDFEYIDDEILLLNCFYQQYGAWVNHNQYEVKRGKITGEKISGKEWELHVNIETNPLFSNEKSKTIDFTEIFIE